MKLFTSRFTIPISATPVVSAKVTVNVSEPAPRAGLTLPTEIGPAGVHGACHTPNACHPVLSCSVSRAARYAILFPPNADLKVMLRVIESDAPLPVVDVRLTVHWLF